MTTAPDYLTRTYSLPEEKKRQKEADKEGLPVEENEHKKKKWRATHGPPKLFTGSVHPQLAHQIAEQLGTRVSNASVAPVSSQAMSTFRRLTIDLL